MNISIIIPTQNRCDLLKQTIDSIAAQNFEPDEFEILVIDNCSTDETKSVTLECKNQHSKNNIQYIYEPIPGLLSGRHKGALEAQGDILIFVDDDIIANKNWLSSIFETFQDSTVHLVGGKCLPNYETEPPYWIEYLWVNSKNGKTCGDFSLIDFGDEKKEIDAGFVWGLNYAIRKKTLFDIGGFNPDTVPKKLQQFQGDGESGLSKKIQKAGLKTIYQPKALVYHFVPTDRMTFEYIYKRRYFQGVADSYTNVRQNKKPDEPQQTLPVIPTKRNDYQFINLFRKFYHFISGKRNHLELLQLKYELDIVKQEVLALRTEMEKTDTERTLKKIMKTAYQQGYAFHQNEVKKNPTLLDWILKENYWDWDYLKI